VPRGRAEQRQGLWRLAGDGDRNVMAGQSDAMDFVKDFTSFGRLRLLATAFGLTARFELPGTLSPD
jgi:hypothetical protein